MNGYLSEPLIFLIDILAGLYILCVLLRFLLQWVRGDFYNPLSRFLVTVTNPLLRPLRRIIPGWRGLDFASLLLALALKLATLGIIALILGLSVTPGGLAIGAIAKLISLVLYIFIFAIVAQAILSWVQPYGQNPMSSLLHSLTAPILRPARRIVPPIGGLDLSPMAAIIGLVLVQMLLLRPLFALAVQAGLPAPLLLY